MSQISVSSETADAAASDFGLDHADASPLAGVMKPDVADGTKANAIKRSPSGSVAILLCTYNGARYLPLQLASFEAQDFTGWRLFVSDDGSTDETPALLAQFQAKHGAERVQLCRGPRKGASANFLSLICDPSVRGDFYALSDQDDVWAADKLSRARAFLMSVTDDKPCVYCTRTRMIDEHGVEIGLTRRFTKPPQFRSALVQNIAIGNTTAFNEATRVLLMQVGPDVNVSIHDWWIYLVATAVGGRVMFDPYPSVNYRLHGQNVVGANNSRLRRGLMLLRRFKGWNDANVGALEHIAAAMLPENRKTFESFRGMRQRSMLPRLYGLMRSGIRRETMLDNVGLMLAALTGQL